MDEVIDGKITDLNYSTLAEGGMNISLEIQKGEKTYLLFIGKADKFSVSEFNND